MVNRRQRCHRRKAVRRKPCQRRKESTTGAFNVNDASYFASPTVNKLPKRFSTYGAHVPFRESRESVSKAALEANQTFAAKAATESTE